MYLTRVVPLEAAPYARWSIYAPCDADGLGELAVFLSQQPPNLRRHALGMLALLVRVAVTGPQGLPDDLCHQVSKGIWEFRKGRLRVFWFYDEGKLIICSHGHIKRSQKVPPAEIARAEACMGQYFEAKKRGTLFILRG